MCAQLMHDLFECLVRFVAKNYFAKCPNKLKCDTVSAFNYKIKPSETDSHYP